MFPFRRDSNTKIPLISGLDREEGEVGGEVRPHVSAEKPPATIKSPRHKQAAYVKKEGKKRNQRSVGYFGTFWGKYLNPLLSPNREP